MFNAGANYTSAPTTKWIGFGNFQVIAVNPDQAEFEQLTGKSASNWKGYIHEGQDGTTSLRVTFLLKDTNINSEVPVQQLTLWLRRRVRKNKDQTKTQVIDQYGNTAWVTEDEFQKQAVPVYSNGNPAAIIPPYRPCCDGEDKIVDFLRALWRANPTFRWDKEAKRMVQVQDDLRLYVFQLEKIKDYWDGDFSELQQAIKDEAVQYNDINAMLYLRKSEYNGNEVLRQECHWMVTPGYSTFDRIQREFEREQQLGMHSSDRYAFVPMFKFTPELPPATAGASKPISWDEQLAKDAKEKYGDISQTLKPSKPLDGGDDELPF